MSAAVVSIPQTLEEIEAEIGQVERRRADLGNERTRLTSQAQAIDAQISKLKIDSVEDPKALKQLDRLEQEKRDIDRRLEGIQLSSAPLGTQLSILQQSHRRILEARDQERQEQKVAEYLEAASKLAADMLESWREACRVKYELAVLLTAGTTDPTLSEAHHQQIRMQAEKIRRAVFDASLEPVNKRWPFMVDEWTIPLMVKAVRPPGDDPDKDS